MVGEVEKRVSNSFDSERFRSQISNLSEQELKESLLISNYKLALLRAQIETLSNILIKHNLASYEEIWNATNNNLEELK